MSFNPHPHDHQDVHRPRLPLYTTSLPFIRPSPSPSASSTAVLFSPAPDREHSPDSPLYRSGRPRSRRAFSLFSQRTTLLRALRRYRPPPLVQYALALLALAALAFVWRYELHVELAAYRRGWIKTEIQDVAPLGGCFSPARVSPLYNISLNAQPKFHDVQAGILLKFGFDCYGLAGTIQPLPHEPRRDTTFHIYWRADLRALGEREVALLNSFFATQDLAHATLILWSDVDLSGDPRLAPFFARFPANFRARTIDIDELAKGTALQGSALLRVRDRRAWVDGDLVRLLLLWTYGGVWVDMDTILTRDLQPLLEHEFVTQWDCYDKPYSPLNGALMHFRQHSPYICEMLHIILSSPPPRAGTTEWGALLYHKTYRRLLSASPPIEPFKILPYCFTDGRSCRLDNRLPDPFVRDPAYDERRWAELRGRLDAVFAVHLHGQYGREFAKGGWVRRLLMGPQERRVEEVAASVERRVG